MKPLPVAGLCVLVGAAGFFAGVWTRDSIADQKQRSEMNRLFDSFTVTPEGKVIASEKTPVRQFTDTRGLFR